METTEVRGLILHDHAQMRAQLAEWEAGLTQLAASGLLEFQEGLERLWKLVPFFEEEVARHFREEESELFAAVKARRPQATAALKRFSAEHAEFARNWQGYKLELLCCDSVWGTQRLCAVGHWLIRLLRQHMQNEEQELLPLLAEG